LGFWLIGPKVHPRCAKPNAIANGIATVAIAYSLTERSSSARRQKRSQLNYGGGLKLCTGNASCARAFRKGANDSCVDRGIP
jgi:hypothetical protein